MFSILFKSLHSGYFYVLLLSSGDFYKIYVFKIFFHEHNQSVIQFGSRSEQLLCPFGSGSKLFAKVILRRQESPLARKELILRSNTDLQEKKLVSLSFSYPIFKGRLLF